MPPSVPVRTVPVAALVLCPDELFNHNSIFNSLHVRANQKAPFEMFPLDSSQIERYFNKYSENAKALLSRFNDEDIAFEVSQLKKKHAKEKSGMPLDRFLDKTVTRYVHQMLSDLMQAAPELRTYHRVRNPANGNYLISRCTIHKTIPIPAIRNGEGRGWRFIYTTYTAMRRKCFPIEQGKALPLFSRGQCGLLFTKSQRLPDTGLA